MSTYTATVHWTDSGPDFLANQYSREHQWTFSGGITVKATAAPDIVPAPWSVAANVNPEEAFVAALSSCHMLFFLSLAAKRGFQVRSYTDPAEGVMEKNVDGKLVISRVTLSPKAVFSGDKQPDAADLDKLHHHAHELCFLANSVRSEVRVKPVL